MPITTIITVPRRHLHRQHWAKPPSWPKWIPCTWHCCTLGNFKLAHFARKPFSWGKKLALIFLTCRQQEYEKSVDVCTDMLEKNPYDEAVWSLKTRALTAQVSRRRSSEEAGFCMMLHWNQPERRRFCCTSKPLQRTRSFRPFWTNAWDYLHQKHLKRSKRRFCCTPMPLQRTRSFRHFWRK